MGIVRKVFYRLWECSYFSVQGDDSFWIDHDSSRLFQLVVIMGMIGNSFEH